MTGNTIIEQLEAKYNALGEKHETYLKGLLHAKPINYWEYVGVDTLLTLQNTRTNFKDEEIFIMYHQVTELVLKMMIHEIKQLVYENLIEIIWIDKLNRLNRYTTMLITSFDVMKSGMSYDDYNTFRSTLTPASGFQSAQFRLLEIYCTRLPNLINEEGKKRMKESPSVEDYFENIYWKDAGHNRQTGKKSLTLRQFEEKYQSRFISLAKKLNGKTLEDKVLSMGEISENLQLALKNFDFQYNVAWPQTHLHTAQHYLDKKGENKAATGGSDWKKYLHPKFQQRKFFPNLWTTTEKDNWGENTPATSTKYTKDSIVGEVVAEDYRTASVFKELGIDFCCQGNRSIVEACQKDGASLSETLVALERIHESNEQSKIDFKAWPLDLLADYIEKIHHRYVEEKSLEIKPYLDKICKVHGDNHPELWEIKKEFDASIGELAMHMKREELILFPFIRQLVIAKKRNESKPDAKFETVNNPIDQMLDEHNVEGERFRKISALSDNYTIPADACNTYKITYAMLKEFEDDLHNHIHLENNILFPMVLKLEKQWI